MSALRAFFDGMTGRIFILMVVSISVSVATSLTLADARQDAAINKARIGVLVERAGRFVTMVNDAPPDMRERLLLEGLPGLRVAPVDPPLGPTDEQLTQSLSAALPAYARPNARTTAPHVCLTPTGAAAPRLAQASDLRAFLDLDCWIISAATQDGQALSIRLMMPHQANTLPLAEPAFLLLSFLAFSIIALVVARMAARPLNELAAAADALGDDLDRSPMPLHGPTEVRAAARAFNAMQELLRRQMKERRQMLGAITHDLQTPLTRLRLRIEKVEDEALRLRLIGDLALMQSLIREGLELARGDESSEATGVLHVDSLLESLAEDAAEAGHKVVFTQRCKRDIEVKPQALRRAVANLLDNAIKYADGAELSAEAGPEGLVIRVRDDGPGLPEDRLRDVFEPFVRLESSRSRETGGSGLGLTIARMLAQKTGASLSIRNRPEGGLEASILFPPTLVVQPRRSARRAPRDATASTPLTT